MKQMAHSARKALERHFKLHPEDSPVKLAARAGVHFTTVYNLRRGKGFRSDTWDKLAPHLDMEVVQAA